MSEQVQKELHQWLRGRAAARWDVPLTMQLGMVAAGMLTASLAVTSLLAMWRFILYGTA